MHPELCFPFKKQEEAAKTRGNTFLALGYSPLACQKFIYSPKQIHFLPFQRDKLLVTPVLLVPFLPVHSLLLINKKM